MNTLTPEMVKAGVIVLRRADEVSPETAAEMVYRAMAAAAPPSWASQAIADLERQLLEATELVRVQRERIQAADMLLEGLRERVGELEETYLGRTPQPH